MERNTEAWTEYQDLYLTGLQILMAQAGKDMEDRLNPKDVRGIHGALRKNPDLVLLAKFHIPPPIQVLFKQKDFLLLFRKRLHKDTEAYNETERRLETVKGLILEWQEDEVNKRPKVLAEKRQGTKIIFFVGLECHAYFAREKREGDED